MADKIQQGQGATRERMRHSNISTGARETTRGGIVTSYGHRDEEHCLLDWMLAQGIIEQDQYEAGYRLRNLFYRFNKTGRWIDEGGKGYDGDTVTDADIAEERYNAAIRAVALQDRGLMRFVCVEADAHQTAGIYAVAMNIQAGLDDLKKFFMVQR